MIVLKADRVPQVVDDLLERYERLTLKPQKQDNYS